MCFWSEKRLGVRLRRARGVMGRDEGKIAKTHKLRLGTSLTIKCHARYENPLHNNPWKWPRIVWKRIPLLIQFPKHNPEKGVKENT